MFVHAQDVCELVRTIT